MAPTNQKLTNMLLYSVEGVGAVFVVIFLAAYLGGLPTNNVLQDEPVFRIPLQIFGAVLLVLILVTVVVAAVSKKTKR
jgi:Na+-transporting methylmalonyl-CoA/oxaloacetate decarboxylase gamma subunit